MLTTYFTKDKYKLHFAAVGIVYVVTKLAQYYYYYYTYKLPPHEQGNVSSIPEEVLNSKWWTSNSKGTQCSHTVAQFASSLMIPDKRTSVCSGGRRE
jgi:hypothetical protein